MKQFIRQERKFLAAMVLTLLLIFAGIFMVFRVFQQYESLIIENEDRQLLGLARSVDRSITSYLQQISRDLLHTLQRDGMEEAEETYRRTGDPGALARQLEGTILTQHPLAYDVLCLEGESILYSARGKTDYTFPADAGLAGDVAIRPCLDADGTIYLSFVKETESRLQYAVLVELTAFYDTVAGNLIAGTARPPKVQVQSRLQCRHLWLYGNEIQLSQMLLNLILNAYQAIEAEGGTLTVTTGAEGDEICFRIADTGPGIDPAVRKDIFEPFFTTKERGKGTGLGLAIVQQVAQEHHGKVCVDSEPGRGTTMTVRLPMPAREDETEPDSL